MDGLGDQFYSTVCWYVCYCCIPTCLNGPYNKCDMLNVKSVRIQDPSNVNI